MLLAARRPSKRQRRQRLRRCERAGPSAAQWSNSSAMRCDAIIHDTNISHRINCLILLEARWTIGRAVIRTSWTLGRATRRARWTRGCAVEQVIRNCWYCLFRNSLLQCLSHRQTDNKMKVLNSALGVAGTPTTHI